MHYAKIWLTNYNSKVCSFRFFLTSSKKICNLFLKFDIWGLSLAKVTLGEDNLIFVMLMHALEDGVFVNSKTI